MQINQLILFAMNPAQPPLEMCSANQSAAQNTLGSEIALLKAANFVVVVVLKSELGFETAED